MKRLEKLRASHIFGRFKKALSKRPKTISRSLSSPDDDFSSNNIPYTEDESPSNSLCSTMESSPPASPRQQGLFLPAAVQPKKQFRDVPELSETESSKHQNEEEVKVFENDYLNFNKEHIDITEEIIEEYSKEMKSDYPFYLKMNLERGIDLVAKDFTGYSDPYVKFIVDGRTLYKSKTVNKNLNPVWSEYFQLPISSMEKSVLIQVYDHDYIGRDDLIGSTWIDLTNLELNQLYNFTQKLEDPKSADQDLGMIKFSFEAHEKQELEMQNTSVSTEGSLDTESLRTSSKESDDRKLSEFNGVVMVEITKCTNLKAMDANGYSDPYVKIALGKQRFKSKVKSHTLNPVFKENCSLRFSSHESTIDISVWDRDSYMRNDFIGSTKIELVKLEPDRTHRLELGLKDKKSEDVGHIEMVVSVTGIQSYDIALSTPPATFDTCSSDRYSLQHTFDNFDEIGRMSITIIRAENLTAADLSGKSDPFTVVELGNERLRTHTVNKSLHPEWNKTFDLEIKDLSHVLYVTIYDEDSNGRAEFLGKIALPLYDLENHFIVKYALKDRDFEPDARGSIVLKASIHYNVIRAAYAMFHPADELRWREPISIDRQLLQRNVQRTMDIVFKFFDIASFLNSLFTWKYPLRSVIGLVIYTAIVYYFEIWMLPMFASAMLLWGLLKPHILGVNKSESGGSQPTQKKTPDLGIKDKVNIFKETLQKCQNGLDVLASSFERVGSVFHWNVPFSSNVAVVALLVVTLLLYLIPLRAIVMIWGLNKFMKRLIKPNYQPSNELYDFLSRLPSKPEAEERRNTVLSRKRIDPVLDNEMTC